MNFKKISGFTLIEVLVVIAIATILMAIVFGNIASSRARVRDDRRVSDIKSIQLALTLYKSQDPGLLFPDTLDDLKSGGFLPEVPLDPSTDVKYAYVHDSNRKKYHLWALIETTGYSQLSQDKNSNSTGWPANGSINGFDASASDKVQYYDVTN